jgi:hypothetical protein
MERSYKFAVLRASPDERRGERVNIGLAVAEPGGTLDIRLPEARKLRHLTGHHWEQVADAYADQLKAAWRETPDIERLGGTPSSMSEVFSLGAPGSLRVREGDYEERVRSILRAMVERPLLSRAEKQERINTEIAHVLKDRGVLGQKDEDLDSARVIPKFVVSPDKAIVADFVRKGPTKIRIVSTLDLRGSKIAAHSKACEKGAVFYFARERFGDDTEPMGVYAAGKSETNAHKSEIEILSSFAGGNIFNWLVPSERQRFQHAL